MKKGVLLFAINLLLLLSVAVYAQPSVDLFKQVFESHIQKLKSSGVKRTISFIQVTAGKPNGGYYLFTVTAYVHDYTSGYPANKYYGETCLGKIDGWKYDMLKDGSGNWTVQGRF